MCMVYPSRGRLSSGRGGRGEIFLKYHGIASDGSGESVLPDFSATHLSGIQAGGEDRK